MTETIVKIAEAADGHKSSLDGTEKLPIAPNSFTEVVDIKNYVLTFISGLLTLKGNTDCSGNPNYPSGVVGDSYYVSVAGKIGGASGKSVDVGDVYICKTNNAGGAEGSVGTSWFVLEHNLLGALLASNNLSDLASVVTARANLGIESAAVDVASGSTTNIGAAASMNVRITGTTTITAFDNVAAGIWRIGYFSGALTLTHNGTSLILPGAANITTAAGDGFIARSLGSGNWKVILYQKANGTAIVGSSGAFEDLTTSETNTALVAAPDGAGGLEFRAETGGGGTSNPASGFNAHKNGTDQSISTSSPTKLTFGTEIFDLGGEFASSTFTVGSSGYYNFKCAARVTAIGTGTTNLYLRLYKNGSLYRTLMEVIAIAGLTDITLQGSLFDYFVATDTIEIYAEFTGLSAGSAVIEGDANATWFSGVREAANAGVATDVIWDTKGDLAVGTGSDAAAKLAATTNGYVLTLDSTQTTGMKWAATTGGSSVRSIDNPNDSYWTGGDLGFDLEFDSSGASLPSGVAWVNQDSSAYNEEFGAGVISRASQAGDHNYLLVRSLSGAPSTWLITAKFSVDGYYTANYLDVGLVLRDSSGTKFYNFVLRNLLQIACFKWNSPTSFSAVQGSVITTIPPSYVMYLRIRKNSGTSYDFEYSYDGLKWRVYQSGVDISAFLAIDQYGSMMLNSTGEAAGGNCHWIRLR